MCLCGEKNIVSIFYPTNIQKSAEKNYFWWSVNYYCIPLMIPHRNPY